LSGRRFANNPELEQALSGTLVSEISRLEGNDKPEHIALAAGATGYFIEAYFPMRLDGEVVGVVELYKMPTALETAISRGDRIIEGAAALAGLVLFATLYWIVRRGALQIQRQQADLLRMDALAAVGQMASAIAHSLRNPLAGIRSSAELLRLEHPGTRPAPDEIIGEVDRLNEYVRELMEYARNDAVSLERIDPLHVVCGTLYRQRAALERAGMEVTIDDKRRVHRPVEVDPPGLLIHHDPQFVAKSASFPMEEMLARHGCPVTPRRSEQGTGWTVLFTDRTAGADREAGLTFRLRQNANGYLPA
jgi:two-component system sensor histidine kinase HydH